MPAAHPPRDPGPAPRTPPVRIRVPARLRDGVGRRGDGASGAWLAALPALVAEFLDRWDLTPERVQEPGGRTGLVVLVRRPDGSAAALKAQPAAARTAAEAEALTRWNGCGAARLLTAAPDRGVLLLERLRGDVPLRSLAESAAMLEACEVARRLWVPPGPDARPATVADRVRQQSERLRRHGDPLLAEARPLVDAALADAAALLAEEPERTLLHGDLHHAKILAGERMPWLAVGPRPLAGERAYDLARLARDRLDTLAGSPGPESAARRRLRGLSEALEVDPGRLRGWARFRAVAAAAAALRTGERRRAQLLLEFAAWL